jgi:hypothetical protein
MKKITVYPDKDETKYKYSDGLFDWFWDKVKYYYSGSIDVKHDREYLNEVDLKQTKEDNSENGCRVWSKEGYWKYYDLTFVLEIQDGMFYNLADKYGTGVNEKLKVNLSLKDLVNYYYEKQ